MNLRLTAYAVLLFSGFMCSIVAAQESPRRIEIKEENGFQAVAIPLLSFKKDDSGSIEIIGEGQLNGSSQRIRFQIGSNESAPKKGVTHTDKSCVVSIDEKLFRALAEHLSVTLLSSGITPKPHSFDLVEVEGTLDNAPKLPVKLEIIDLVDDDTYSEWYIAFDVPKKSILLSEKSNQYREPFVTTFAR